MDREKAKNILARVVGGATHPSYTDIREACHYALDVLDEPSLPSDLDETAEQCVLESADCNDPNLFPKYMPLLLSLFKSGAMWQAEHRMELTWGDVRWIVKTADSMLKERDVEVDENGNVLHESDPSWAKTEESYYTEVLRRFNENRNGK